MKSIYEIFRQGTISHLPSIYKHRRHGKQLIKFAIAGTIASSVQLGLLFVFAQIIGENLYLIATSMAFVFALIVSFFLQKFWTFRDNETEMIKRQFTIYGTVATINLFINGFVMYFFVDIVGAHYLIAQIIAMCILAIGSFLFHRKITFNNGNNHLNESINNNRPVST